MSNTSEPDILDLLFSYLASLEKDWVVYEELFGEQDNVHKLNHRTGPFFSIIQQSLQDSILLDIAKLFDSVEEGGRTTGSLATAIRELTISDEAKRNRLKGELRTLKNRIGPIIQHRNRRLAHIDRKVAMDEDVLNSVSRGLVKESIDGINALFRKLFLIQKDSDVSMAVPGSHEAVIMLRRVLDAGNAILDEKERRGQETLRKLKAGETVEQTELDDLLKSHE